MKKEQELAERRKNDPQPDLAQDHLVRKIFSKFRKPSESSVSTTAGVMSRPCSSQTQKLMMMKTTGVPSADPEQGRRNTAPVMPLAKKRQPTQLESLTTSESRASSATSKGSFWATLTGTARDNNNTVPSTLAVERDGGVEKDSSDAHTRRTELVCRKSEYIQVVKDIRPPTQGNEWPKVLSPRPDTIDETSEPTADGLPRQPPDKGKHMSMLSGVTTTNAGTVAPSSAAVAPLASSGSSSSVVQPTSINNADYQQIIASLIDMRIDLKLEIQKLSNKIVKIDSHIDDVTKKLYAIVGGVQPTVTAIAAATTSSSSVAVPTATASIVISPGSRTSAQLQTDVSTKVQKKDTVPGKLTRTRAPAPTTRMKPVPSTSSTTRQGVVSGDRSPREGETGDVRTMLETEIEEQDVEVTDEDPDLTSKL